MKLLFFISSLGGGGAERVTVNLANYWAAKGWEITIVTLAEVSQDAYALDPSVARLSLSMTGNSKNIADALLQNLRRVKGLRQVLLDTKPDVSLAMMDNSAFLPLAMAVRGLGGIAPLASIRVHPKPSLHQSHMETAAVGCLRSTVGTRGPDPGQCVLASRKHECAPDRSNTKSYSMALAGERTEARTGCHM